MLQLFRNHLHRLRASQHSQLLRIHIDVNIHCLVMTRIVIESLTRCPSLLLCQHHYVIVLLPVWNLLLVRYVL